MGTVGPVSFNLIKPTAAPNATGFFNAIIAAAGVLTLSGALVSGGIGTNDIQRRVAAVSSNSGDTTQVLAITGTNSGGAVISEALTLNGTTPVFTKQDFLAVTKIVAFASTVGTVSIGQNQVASTPWVVPNIFLAPFQVTLAAFVLGGVINYSVEETLDDPNGNSSLAQGFVGAGFTASIEPDSNFPPVPIQDLSTGSITAKASNAAGVLSAVVLAYRLTMNSYTYSAGVGVALQGIQAGLHN